MSFVDVKSGLRFLCGFMAVILSLSGCLDTSDNPTITSGIKTGDLYATWRFSWKTDGSLCSTCDPNKKDSGTLDVTFFSPDSFSEVLNAGRNGERPGRNGHFFRRNDSLFLSTYWGGGDGYEFDSASILQLDNSSLILMYNRFGSPFAMGFIKGNK